MSKDIVNTLKERGYPVAQAAIMDNMWYALLIGTGWVKVSDLFQYKRAEPVPN